MNYKNTLSLPQTDFSMKANLPLLEPKMLSYWEDLDIYNRLRKERSNCKKFILHDGPPYANGLIHIGHALNKILKDIILKYKTLAGYDCPYVVGWDCHGLPVEHQLFKEIKKTKHDVEIIDFRKKARDYALKFVKVQAQDFKRLGIFSNWDKPYITLDPQYEYSVLKLLEHLTRQGYIYRGRKPVNWCAACETALAEAEVEYLDKDSNSIYFLFELASDMPKTYFLVWTTTPWTVVSNVAVALHPDLDYCLTSFNNKNIILAKDLIPRLEENFNAQFKILKTHKGSDFEGSKLKHPFLDRQAPVVLADFVSKEEGSGCVHIAPGHGEEDFSLTKKYPLDIIMPVNDKGIFDEPLDFKGKNIEEANELVIKKLKEADSLIEHQKITHSYPHCWRCKQPIIFRATFQWFLNVDHNDLRSNLLKEIDNVRWVPKNGKERMRNMLSTRPHWCLSRQRIWGVPIPALKCKACGEVVLDGETINKTADIFKKEGSDSWFGPDLNKFLPSNFKCRKCNSNDFTKEFDILDVWFESGASFLAVLKNNPGLNFPADLYLEGSDQHRGWFQASLIPSKAKESVAPFKAILTHGFVVDSEGKKMSKSLGNVIAPQEIYKQYGAEILRLWAAYTDYSEDIKISKDILKQLSDMYRKVRNTIRFILGNISDFNLEDSTVSFDNLLEIDKIFASKMSLFFTETLKFYEEFSFYKVCQQIFNFCNQDLSSFYLDILKDRLYTFSPNCKARRSAQFVLWHTLGILLKLISPILPFTAEEAYSKWSNLKGKKDSIFMDTFNHDHYKAWADKGLQVKWHKILSLRDKVLKEIEKERGKSIIASSLEAQVVLKCKDDDYKACMDLKNVLNEVFIVSSTLIQEGDYKITITKANGKKCMRCWMWSDTVGKILEHPDICSKCSATLKEVKT